MKPNHAISLYAIILFAITTQSCKNVTNHDIPLFPINENGKMGFIDSTGLIIIKPMFDYVSYFNEDLAVAVKDSTYGYIDKTGRWVIKPQFSIIHHILYGTNKYIGPFSLTLENLKTDSIYKQFKQFLMSPHDSTYWYDLPKEINFHEGLAVYYDEKKGYGYIDKKGTVIIKPHFSTAGVFSEGLGCVSVLDKSKLSIRYGYIDKNGNWIIKPTYSFAKDFSEGKAVVNINYGYTDSTTKQRLYNTKIFVLNRQDKILLTPNVQGLSSFRLGFAVCYNILYGRYNYIDTTGNFYFKESFPFNDASKVFEVGALPGNDSSMRADTLPIMLSGKTLLVKVKSKWGFLPLEYQRISNLHFKNIFIYDDADVFSEGLAPVKIDNQWGYINASQSYVLKPQYTLANKFKNGLAFVEQNENGFKLSGYINKKGIMVWSKKRVWK